ncbi:MAG: glutathione S-transferase family protein [Aliihoeflea sp.]|uniref:glutathione S-transferase family protein n=1 Tax=Aliihoeflea sp. TaxID=2608088 RepID=UPI004034404C
MYQAVGSPGSRLTRVTWMLEELGQPYEIVMAKMHTETMLRYNPSGKMPALADGEVVVTDSAAIVFYLADKHADQGMGGTTPAERAEIASWMFFAQAELEAPLWNRLKHAFRLADELRAEVGPWCKAEFATEIGNFDKRLGDRAFALGDRFTAADIILGHCGQWARGAKFVVDSERVNAYFDRVLARPALARAQAREKEVAAT